MSAELELQDQGDGIRALVFNRPGVKNAICRATVGDLARVLTTLEGDPQLRGVVVTGAGGTFVSGGDIRELKEAHDRESGERYGRAMTSNLDRLARLPVPVVAAVEGFCLGGGMEIALACDLRVAGRGATLSFRQLRMALTPGWGGGRRLARLVGRSRALRLLWGAEDLDVDRAEAAGLVDQIAAPGEAMNEALSFVRALAKGPPRAVAGVKAVVDGALDLPAEAARAAELATFLDLWVTEDHTEAVDAFFERRPPRWVGR